MNLYRLLLLLIFSALVNSCGMDIAKLLEQQKLEVKPNPVELHAEEVSFTMSAFVPVDLFKKGWIYTIDVNYQASNKEPMSLGKLEFIADDYVGKESDPLIEESFSFKYDKSLERGDLVLLPKLGKAGGTPKEADPVQVGKGVITTSQMVKIMPFSSYIPSGYRNTEEYEPYNLKYHFLQGKSDLRKNEIEGESTEFLKDYISSNPNTKSLTLTGTHSPEGSTEANERLSKERPQTVKSLYLDLVEQYDYSEEKSSFDTISKSLTFDWTEFRSMIDEYEGISSSQKEELFSIVDGSGDFVSKELRLQTLSYYKRLFRDIYPKLRNAKAQILKIKDKKEDAELALLSKGIVNGDFPKDTLSVEEILYSSELTPSLEEKKAIYLLVKDEDKFHIYNNLGALYLDMAKKEQDEERKNELLDKSVSYLEQSLKKQECPEAYLNLSTIHIMLGNTDEAEESLEKISDDNSSPVSLVSRAQKGYLALKKASYEESIELLSGSGDDVLVLYNKALAYLLNSSKKLSDDYSNASSSFEEALQVDPDNAYAHYGMAIVFSRKSDIEGVKNHLSKALSMDESLKTRASSDLEFQKYFNEAGFKELFN